MIRHQQGAGNLYTPLSRQTWLRKFRNTFLQPKWLWSLVIREKLYQEVLQPRNGQKPTLRWRVQSGMEHPLLRRTGLWFWPSICDAKTWAEGDIGNYRDPSGFREYSPDIEILCETVAQHATAPDAPILDLGCNAGRHLNLMVSKGFTNLHGVDICKRALELMDEWFPETKGHVDLHHDLFQRYLPKLPERFFEIVFTHATTIEAAHPSFNMVKAIARVTAKHAILLIQEHDYHTRFWEHEFRRQGFLLTFIRRPIIRKPVESNGIHATSGKNFSPTTLFVFTRMGVGLNA